MSIMSPFILYRIYLKEVFYAINVILVATLLHQASNAALDGKQREAYSRGSFRCSIVTYFTYSQEDRKIYLKDGAQT